MRYGLLLTAIASLVAGCNPAPMLAGEIRADDLQALIGGADAPLILDVRTPAEYEEGHVPGAINIPHDEVPGRIDEIEAYEAEQVVVYCKSGRRAGLAADALLEAGLPVAHLEGDMSGWQQDGRPIEAPKAPTD